MCMACQEMDLYYAYLDALEAEKRKAQPWQCEVTIIPQPGEADAPAAAPAEPAVRKRPAAKARPASFACDNPE